MGTAPPATASPPRQKDVRRFLALFAALAVVGVVMLAFSVVLGIVVLVVAEVFFVTAYRRFSKSAKAT